MWCTLKKASRLAHFFTMLNTMASRNMYIVFAKLRLSLVLNFFRRLMRLFKKLKRYGCTLQPMKILAIFFSLQHYCKFWLFYQIFVRISSVSVFENQITASVKDCMNMNEIENVSLSHS